MKMKKLLSLISVLAFVLLPCVSVSAEEISQVDKVEYVTYNVQTGDKSYSYYDVLPPASLANVTLSQPGFLGTESVCETIDNGVDPCTVFDGHPLQTVTNYSMLPYRAVCYLSVKFPDYESTRKSARGTGFLFGPDSLLTAGHVLYNEDRGGWATEVIVYPARNGDSKPYIAYGIEFGLATPYTENGDVNYDYALVKLDRSIGSQIGYLGYAYNLGAVGNSVTLIGYPGEVNGVTKQSQYYTTGTISQVTQNRLKYNASSEGGMSGCPIMLNSTVIGIHTHQSSTYNAGKRIHYDMYMWMIEW